MPHRQREARESERIRMAASAARAATGSALDAALAQSARRSTRARRFSI
ncbi:MAG: hypothetical protein WA199_13985 [Xanthobacteraceae bacterium]